MSHIRALSRNYLSGYEGLSSQIWIGIILSFLEATFAGVYYFLSIYFVHDLHISIGDAGIIISCYGMGTILGGLIGGWMADKLGAMIVSILFLFLQAFSYIAMLWITSPHLLMINLFLFGIVVYGFITASYTWVLGECGADEGKRLRVISILSIASNLGIGLSAIIIGMTAMFSFHSLFLISGVFLFCCAGLMLPYARNKAQREVQQMTSQNIQQDISESKSRISMLLVFFSLFLIGIVIAQLGATYPIYLQESFPEHGLNGVSQLFVINTFLIVFLQNPLINFFKQHNKMLMSSVGALLLGAGMFILSWSPLFALAILSCVIYTFGEMLFFSMTQLVCYQNTPQHKKGRGLGLYRMVFAASRIAGPAAGGFIYTQYSPQILWLFCGTLGLMSMMVCGWGWAREIIISVMPALD